MNTEAANLHIPIEALIDREYGDRQDAFRQRVSGADLTTQRFSNPEQLGALVERSLHDLAQTRLRIASGIEREQRPPKLARLRGSKFVNPAPTTAPSWFQDRRVETRQLAEFLFEPGMRLVTVIGRAGVGKTAMVCRLLKGLEAGLIPGLDDEDAELASMTVDGIVYLSQNGRHPVGYPHLIGDLLRLMPADDAKRIEALYQDPHNPPGQVMSAILEAFPAGGRVVVLLDNLESVMDIQREALTETALHEALVAVLRAPEHGVKVIATTQVPPTELGRVQPGAQHPLRLEEGLEPEDAAVVLRALDRDGKLRLRNAPEAKLAALRERTRGFPRALEAVKAILASDPSLTVADLLENTRGITSDEVVEVLVGEAYEGLDPLAQRVMQALSVYPTAVSAVAVDYLLQPYNPTINSAPILTRLVRSELVRHDSGQYYLHPVDCDYAISRIPASQSDDSQPSYTQAVLRARAADYYVQIRTPRESWRSLDDVRPQLAEFELRCETGDMDTAATVLADVDDDYLRVWGHYRTLIELHNRIQGQITQPALQTQHLSRLGSYHFSMGDYPKAIGLHEEALRICRETSDRQGEAAALDNLATCHASMGDYPKAIWLYEKALRINLETGRSADEAAYLSHLAQSHFSMGDYPRATSLLDKALRICQEADSREGEARAMGNLGMCHAGMGDYPRAIGLYEDSLRINRALGRIQGEANQLSNLGTTQTRLGNYAEAIGLHEAALRINRKIGRRSAEAIGLGNLARARLASGDGQRAVELCQEAIRIADTIGDIESAVMVRSVLARARIEAANPAEALSVTSVARSIGYPLEQPTLEVIEGIALLYLGRVREATGAFRAAVDAADQLLSLATGNPDALDARGLACCGLAITDEPARVREAVDAFRRARAVHTAAGTVAEVTRMLARLGAADEHGVLTTALAATRAS
ncbi:tetratricopeptide repeat protein [Kribbella sp. NPDC055110]